MPSLKSPSYVAPVVCQAGGESCSISANVGEGQGIERGCAYCARWYSAPRPASSCSRSPRILNWLLRSTCAAGLCRCVGLSKFTLAVVPWWVCSYTTAKRVHGSTTGLPKHHNWVFKCRERRSGQYGVATISRLLKITSLSYRI